MPQSIRSEPSRTTATARAAALWLTTLLLLASSHVLRAQEVVAVGEQVVEAEPGEVLTFAYRIFNPSPDPREILPRVDGPSGWRLLTDVGLLTLEPGASEIDLISYAIPPTTPAGEYRVSYAISSLAEGSSVKAKDRRVVVTAVDQLEVDILEMPLSVLGGDVYEALFRVRNESNRRHAVVLSWVQSREMPLVVEPSELDLAAGGSAIVRVIVEVPEDIETELLHQVSLTASLSTDRTVGQTKRIDVAVLPTRTISPERWHRLRGKLTVRALTEKDQSASGSLAHGTLALSGELDEAGRRRIDLFLQAPQSDSSSVEFLREELRLELTTQRFHLLVGDFVPTSSRLFTAHRGRGARFEVNQRTWSLGGRYLETNRWIQARLDEAAVFGELTLGEQRVRLEYSRRRRPERSEESELVDLSARFHPRENLSLRVGLAHGLLATGSSDLETGWGGELEVHARLKTWSYNLFYTYGDSGFPGRNRGRSSLSGGINAPITPRLSLRSSAQDVLLPLEEDLSYVVPPTEREYVSGLSYRLWKSTTVSIDRRTSEREELNDIAAVDLNEKTTRLSIHHSARKSHFGLRVDSGTGKDDAANSTFELSRYAVESSYNPSERFGLDAAIERTREGSLSGERSDALSAYARARWRITENLLLDAYYRRRERQFRTTTDASFSRLRLVRALPNSHELALEVAQSHTEGLDRNREQTALLAYSIPLSVPVRRRKSVGSVQGSVRDEQTGQPLPGVLVRLGKATARTDENGNYSITSLPVGTHPVSLNTTRLGYRRIGAIDNPLRIAVDRGDEQRLDLRVTTVATLEGEVRRDASGTERWRATEQSIREQARANEVPVVDVSVEISNGNVTLHQMTSSKGRFSFDNLRPGKWSLRLVGALPQGYEVVYEHPEFDLPPGGSLQTTVRLLSRRPQIRPIPSDRDIGISLVPLGAGLAVEPVATRPPTTEPSLPAPSTPTTTPTPTGSITRVLNRGVRHAQVRLLQVFLNTHGYTVSQSKGGSPGNETDYFGLKTRDALRRFQCDEGIVCEGDEATSEYGNVGPRTRAAIGEVE